MNPKKLILTYYRMAMAIVISAVTLGWTPKPVANDPLVRMPGTQPGAVDLTGDTSQGCIGCHAGAEPEHWKGSLMAQAARDPIFWAGLTVAAQDAIWALGTPNAADICVKCHFPQGWLEGRSDPVNASLMTGEDFDGVNCKTCHYMYDPFYDATYNGTREGNDWTGYWDEASSLSQTEATRTYNADATAAGTLSLFNGNSLYSNNAPANATYTENGGGHIFIDTGASYHRRGPFADTNTNHDWHYSRYHKSKYFCGTCHDISNPALANLGHIATVPGDGTTILPSESQPAYSYGHVERTFSEFMLSGFSTNGGMAGTGYYGPATFTTSHAGNKIGTCQDCHFRDLYGEAAGGKGKPRPDTSSEHTKTGITEHRMVGGNLWVPYLLASINSGSANYDPVNETLLKQGPAALTLGFGSGYGEPLDSAMLLETVDIAEHMLQSSVSMTNANYGIGNSEFTLRLQNHTGHKLISGYPEGRRMFLNVKAYANNELIYEINPYDYTVGTLKGLENSLSSPELSDWEAYEDELVYEVHQSSSLLGVDETFHMALATERYKDNRILPRGFDVTEAATRLCEPVWHGHSDTNYHASGNYFTQAEYEGGYDEVTVKLPAGTERIEAGLYYQTTSREFMEFLRDEINGVGGTLTGTGAGGDPAYIAQTDPWFSGLAAWGDTIWSLWTNNMHVPGAAPVLMTNTLVQLDVSDTDGDGIPAYWELEHFGGTTNALASIDSDGDGVDNLSEYIAYTIPTDSNSVFVFTAEFDPTNGVTEVVAEFDSLRSRDYALEETTNLVQSTAWTNVSGYMRGIDDEMELVSTNNTKTGIYRIKAKLPGTP